MIKKKILLIASDAGLGGGERNLLDIASSLVHNSDYSPIVLVPKVGLLASELASKGIEVRYSVMPTVPKISSIRMIRELIKDNEISLVHAHGGRAALYARLAIRPIVNIPVVYTVHGVHYPHYRNPLKRWAFIFGERLLKRLTTHFVCVCRSDFNKAVSLGIVDPSKASIIYNGIRAEQLSNACLNIEAIEDHQTEVVLSVGRLHKQKAFDVLLRASQVVVRKRPTVGFLLVGDGEEKSSLLNLKNELGLRDDEFFFVGQQQDITRYLKVAKVFALSSLWEGFPYVILEAMACKKAIIATSVDGIPEAIINEKTGLLVKPHDYNALANAILRLLEDTTLADQLGEQAYIKVLNDFSLEKTIEGIVSVYDLLSRDNQKSL